MKSLCTLIVSLTMCLVFAPPALGQEAEAGDEAGETEATEDAAVEGEDSTADADETDEAAGDDEEGAPQDGAAEAAGAAVTVEGASDDQSPPSTEGKDAPESATEETDAASTEGAEVPSPDAGLMGHASAYGGFDVPLAPDSDLTGLEIGGFVLLGAGVAASATGGLLWGQDYGTAGAATLMSGAGVTLLGALLLYAATETSADGAIDAADPRIDDGPSEDPAIVPSVSWSVGTGFTAGILTRF